MATLPTNRTTSNTRDEHVSDHNELHTGHNLNETHRGRTDNPHGTTAAQVGAQPTDADLTAIAALDSATAGSIASDGAGWIKKTYAQFKTALSLVKADVGLGNVDNTADTAKPVSTAQQAAIDNAVGRLLAVTSYNPATQTATSTTSSSLTDVDATNLAVTFTAPSTGKVLVRLSAVSLTNAVEQPAYWGLRVGAADVADSTVNAGADGGSTIDQAASRAILVTGLTSGTSYTYKWAQKTSNGAYTTYTRYGGLSGGAVMEVWSAP